MKRILKYFLVLLLLLLSLLAVGAFYYRPILEKIKNLRSRIPSPSSIHLNLPGKLIGPLGVKQATSLDPTQIVYWTNTYRAENKLSALKESILLNTAANKKVEDMFKSQYFEHVSPDGTDPGKLILSVGYNYKYAGENLAMGDFRDEKTLVDAWMSSPGHRANILNPNYTEIGVAVGINNILGNYTWLAVQEFGAPSPNCSGPSKTLKSNIDSEKAQADQLSVQHEALVAEYKLSPSADKLNQIRTIENELTTVQAELSRNVTEYNSQVNAYNQCIK